MSPKFDITVKSENLLKTPDNSKSTCGDTFMDKIDSKLTQASSPFKLAQQQSGQPVAQQVNQQQNNQ